MAFGFKSCFGDTNIETVEGLRMKFMNTPLHDYLHVAIPFFFKEARIWEKTLIINTRSAIQNYLDETLQLASLLRFLKLGEAKGKGWHIESQSDILRLYDSVEPVFLQKLDEFPVVLHKYEWEEFTPEPLADWEKALASFPTSSSFEKEEVDDKGSEVGNAACRLSIEEINSTISSIKRCIKVADKFYLESDDAMAKRFVAHMIENGVPESRAMYRCFYDALDCFGGIPDVIKRSHAGLPHKSYPKENYIKAIAKRYHDQKEGIPEQ